MNRTANKMQDGPTLGLLPNPFLEALGARVAYAEIASTIAYSPLKGLPLHNVPIANREDFLGLRKQHFVPTVQAIETFSALQILLREYYMYRNPLSPATRRHIYTLAELKGTEMQDAPWFPTFAAGFILNGITGTGKSTLWSRFAALVPQVVQYSNGEIPGFDCVTQIVWLKVDMSADGSRAGFLLSILSAVDNLIGTNYFTQYTKSGWTVEKLMVVVGIVLATRFCGMLIVEEIQKENFTDSKSSHELAVFFLRLLNFGIPVVLVGNPLGFTDLPTHSQLNRRLTEVGGIRLDPAEMPDDYSWKEALVPGILEFNVMPSKTKITPEIKSALYQFSGGFPDFLARLNAEAQRIALRLGAQAMELSHIEQAYHSSAIKDNHTLIRAFADKDVNLLVTCEDIPTEYYARLWKKNATGDAADQPSKPASAMKSPLAKTPPTKSTVQTKEVQYKSTQTRKAKRADRVKALNATLPNEDMRRHGARDAMISSIDELRRKIQHEAEED